MLFDSGPIYPNGALTMLTWTKLVVCEDMQLFATTLFQRLGISARYYYICLAILVVVLIFAIVKAHGVWEEINDVEEPDSPEDLLEAFEEAHATGELDDEEYERVKSMLATQPGGKGPDLSQPTPLEDAPGARENPTRPE